MPYVKSKGNFSNVGAEVTPVAGCSNSGASLSLEFLFLAHCMHKARALFQSCVNEVSRLD